MKRILSLLISLMLLLSFFVISAAAEDTVINGTCGDNLTWEFDTATDTLTVSGKGDMMDFTKTDYTGSYYYPWPYSEVEHLVIEKGVTSIGINAFRSLENLKSVSMADTVTKISHHAFYRCRNLTSVIFSNKLKNIGTEAFYECRMLRSTSLPDTVTSIGKSAFNGCTRMTVDRLPGALKTLGIAAFSRCSSLTTIAVPEGITTLDNSTFYGCTKLSSVRLPESLTTIGDNVFDGCTGLTKIVIPDSVSTIGKESFEDCTNLVSVNMPKQLTWLDDAAFRNCTSLKSITLPSGMAFIGEEAFYNCQSLTSVTIPAVEHIGNSTFANCLNLETVILRAGSGNIGGSTFANCPKLKTVSVPKSLRTVGSKAFYQCAQLTDIDLSLSVSSIGSSAFYGCTGLTDLIFSDTLSFIGEEAFRECRNVRSVTIPDTLAKIRENAFLYCDALTEVNYSGSPTQRKEILMEDGNEDLRYADWSYGRISSPEITVTYDSATGKPLVTWSRVSGGAKYRIYRSETKTGTYTFLKTAIAATSYLDTTAEAGNRYYYKVKVIPEDASLKLAYSTTDSELCHLSRPNMTVSRVTASGKPKITWTPVEGAVKYTVHRITVSSNLHEHIHTAISKLSFVDETAEPGVEYRYSVRARHSYSMAISDFAPYVTQVCDLPKPVLSVSLTASGYPRLTWDAIEGAVKYRVYRSDSKDGSYTFLKTTITATSFTDTGAEAGKTYYYKIRALHENVEANSAYSSIQSITAK